MKNIIEQFDEEFVFEETIHIGGERLKTLRTFILKALKQKEKEITEKFNEKLKGILHHDTIAKEEAVLNAERNWVKKLDEKEGEVKRDIIEKINEIVNAQLEMGEKHQKDFKRHEKENDLVGATIDNENLSNCMEVVKSLEYLKKIIN